MQIKGYSLKHYRSRKYYNLWKLFFLSIGNKKGDICEQTVYRS